ncbi:DNA mismatch repair endonuclease MutL [Pseudooceanicola sp.]|uniref:DNA mismatch repair endonuclease MutL n=1 Tax=Pseudooceanicola sp. TaxID=1914328 RepID=UPI00260CEB2C|nr:DNA mismatch repair endonuclease MutL [Pseudooceanicola sp.]MDF1855684.1 DNA mismatch repair endonuclease MutL [Pseudooceanicola sp.]
MNSQTRYISPDQPVIRQLDEAAINRIAAGEVVERPASAVKELVENALDAGARRIAVTIADGGKTLIRVSDDGCGIAAEDLPLALARHATSKIDGSDLLDIHTFGFRGEALPSLGAVGRLRITSRVAGGTAAEITVSGGRMSEIRPAALSAGTSVELRDLFFATPARLKFLRSDRAESQAVTDMIRRLAMAEPFVSFALKHRQGEEEREVFRADAEQGELFDALANRLASVLGREFIANAIPIDAERDGLQMTGFAALPTYSRGAAVAQYLFVNGRPVRDRALSGALRAAYTDLLSRDRHPAAALFIDCDPHLVDVNVHPAKTEVRFRDPGTARGLIVSGLRHALAENGHRAASTVAGATLGAFRAEPTGPRVYQMDRAAQPAMTRGYPTQPAGWSEPAAGFTPFDHAPTARVEDLIDAPPAEAHPLGAARAQVHENYIIAQTETGMVIVDQHAAHERLVYERLKRQMAENGVTAQALLIPEIVELSPGDRALLLDHAEALAQFGLGIEAFGGNAVAVRETPAELGEVNAEAMLRDILDELGDAGDSDLVQSRLDAILSRIACHGSIRSGRRMRGDEMNALLREMEATPHSGQCNHGRPTYVELKLADIERLFGRT